MLLSAAEQYENEPVFRAGYGMDRTDERLKQQGVDEQKEEDRQEKGIDEFSGARGNDDGGWSDIDYVSDGQGSGSGAEESEDGDRFSADAVRQGEGTVSGPRKSAVAQRDDAHVERQGRGAGMRKV